MPVNTKICSFLCGDEALVLDLGGQGLSMLSDVPKALIRQKFCSSRLIL
jgi:hypothetical protein